MHFLLALSFLAVSASAIPAPISSDDVCLQAMVDAAPVANPFCSAFTSGENLLEEIVDALVEGLEDELDFILSCSSEPSKISSACSCLKTITSTSSIHRATTTSFKSSTKSSSVSTTSTKPTVSSTNTSSSTLVSTASTILSTTSSSQVPISSSNSSSSIIVLTSSSFITSTSSEVASSTISSVSSTSNFSESPTSTLSSSNPSSTSLELPSSASSTSILSSTSSEVPSYPSSTSSSAPILSSSAPSSTSSESSSAPTSSSSPSSTSTAPSSARTSPAAGAIVVDASNSTVGSYITVGQGVSALSLTSTAPQILFIYPGTYEEQVYIPALKSNLTVQGYTTDATSYYNNTATITYDLALLNTTSDDLTATLRQWNTNTKVYNLNIANTFGHVSTNGQNLALSAHTGNQGYYGVQLWGYQDTLLSNTGNQLYAKSLIVGAIDFIFGQTATAWFDQVDIRTIATGCVTASGRASATNPSWYVINNSTVDGINSTIAAGINYLGRPWESFARVVFQNTYLGAIINPAGWRVWSTAVNGTTNIGNVTFAEYDNYGPGSILEEGPRANFSEQLNTSITIESILGNLWFNEWWVDLSYMPYAT